MASRVSRLGSSLLQRISHRKGQPLLRTLWSGWSPAPVTEAEDHKEKSRSSTSKSLLHKPLCAVNEWRTGPGKWMSSVALEDAPSSSSDGLTITENCIKRLRDIQKEEKTEKLLRLSVEGGGCSGFLYNFSLEEGSKPDDRVFEKDGVKIIVDEVSLSFLKGSTVDFTEELIRSTFVVLGNPNSASSCGCGSSFTAK